MTQSIPSGGISVVSKLSRSESEERAMSTIAAVHALKQGLCNPVIPPAVLRAVETIHAHVSKQTEYPGWSRVDWRTTRGGRGGGGGGRGGGGSRDAGRGFQTSRPGNSAAATEGGLPSGPPAKYVSQFKQTDKAKDAVLLIILDKLNKFAPKNYTDIYDFLCQILDDGQTSFLKDFMKVVFEKATHEEMFCAHYVKLLCELSEKYSILSNEMIERYKEYSLLFTSPVTTTEPSDDEEQVSEKNYLLGYSQFLAELVKYNVLEPELFVETLEHLIGNIPVAARLSTGKRTLENYVDCLLRILREIKTQNTALAATLRTVLKVRFLAVLEPLTIKDVPEFVSLGAKGRFGIIDIVRLIKSL